MYQKILSPALKQLFGMQSMCRFTPSCSEYTKRSIQQHGVIEGSWMGLLRLMQCQPFTIQKAKIEVGHCEVRSNPVGISSDYLLTRLLHPRFNRGFAMTIYIL